MRLELVGILMMMGTTVLAEQDRSQPIVGAIRWDGFYGQEKTVKEVEQSMGPKKFHFRLPFFAKIRYTWTRRTSAACASVSSRKAAGWTVIAKPRG